MVRVWFGLVLGFRSFSLHLSRPLAWRRQRGVDRWVGLVGRVGLYIVVRGGCHVNLERRKFQHRRKPAAAFHIWKVAAINQIKRV
jgi:hypothetical protein